MPDHPTKEPREVDYPPMPWRMRGTMSAGVFSVAQPPAIADGLRPFVPRRLAVVLVRYLEGTLSYDELIVGSMARLGRRAGLYVHRIWVNDLASLWGGRRHWGLPKHMAEFTWKGSSFEVADGDGLLVAGTVAVRSPRLPAVTLPLSGFGRLDDTLLFTTSRLRARWAPARMELTRWSDRLPALTRPATPVCAVADPFRIIVPPPVELELA
jgi:Acetoacetate decarboxylase (ADC)